MANPVGGGNPPGGAGNSKKYPQWGVNPPPASGGSYSVTEARNTAQKNSDIQAGYVEWFLSKTAAQNWIKGQKEGLLSGNIPSPLSGTAAIGDFFGRLTEASTWVRAGEIVLGIILIAIGVARLTKAVPIATQIARTAGATAI